MSNVATTRAVTIIPATIDLRRSNIRDIHAKRRVAGYARVSTDQEEQLTSYEAQVDYYTRHIKSNPDWEFVTVYAYAVGAYRIDKEGTMFGPVRAELLATLEEQGFVPEAV